MSPVVPVLAAFKKEIVEYFIKTPLFRKMGDLLVAAMAAFIAVTSTMAYQERQNIWHAVWQRVGVPILDRAMGAEEIVGFHTGVAPMGAEATFLLWVDVTSNTRGVVSWTSHPRSHELFAAMAQSKMHIPLGDNVHTQAEIGHLLAGKPFWVGDGSLTNWTRLVMPVPPRYSSDGSLIVGMLVVAVNPGISEHEKLMIEALSARWAIRLAGI